MPCLLLVCSLSFLSSTYISDAGTGLTTWSNARENVYNAKVTMDTERDNYHVIRGDLETLIDEWNDNEQSKADQDLLNFLAAAGAIISVASGGSLYPAAYVLAVTTAKATHNKASYNKAKKKYLTSMSALLSLMDTARVNVDAAYNGGYLTKEPPGIYEGSVDYMEHTPGYVPEYNAYLSMAVAHLNGYTYYVGKYENEVTLEFGVLESSVKGGGKSGYYHRGVHDGDENSKQDHVFTKFMTFADFVVRPDLPYNYVCYGVCGTTFRTPYEAFYAHRTRCGTAGETIHAETGRRYNEDSSSRSWTGWYNKVLEERRANPSLGCGEWYYICKDLVKHELRFVDSCRCPYRKCLGRITHVCDDEAQGALSPGLSPANGSYYASAGGTHEAKLVTSEPYYYVRWYVKGPGDTSSLGTLVETDEGWSTGTETEASLSYTFSTSASGEYTITAVSERYSDLSQGSTRSYTVTVE